MLPEFPDNLELLDLFGCEPVYVECEDNWKFGKTVFSIALEEDNLLIEFYATYGEMAIEWKIKGERRAYLRFKKISRFEAIRDKTSSHLKAHFEKNAQPEHVLISIKPTIKILLER